MENEASIPTSIPNVYEEMDGFFHDVNVNVNPARSTDSALVDSSGDLTAVELAVEFGAATPDVHHPHHEDHHEGEAQSKADILISSSEPPHVRTVPIHVPPQYRVTGKLSKSSHQVAALKYLYAHNNSHPKPNVVKQFAQKNGLQHKECLQWLKGQRTLARKSVVNNGPPLTSHKRPIEASFTTIDAVTTTASISKRSRSLYGKQPARSSMSSQDHGDPSCELMNQLNRSSVKRAREWAVHYTLTDSAAEKEFMIVTLVDQLDLKRRKELRSFLLKQPLKLTVEKDFVPRKVASDPNLTRGALKERAELAWDFLQMRFGAAGIQQASSSSSSDQPSFFEGEKQHEQVLLDAGTCVHLDNLC